MRVRGWFFVALAVFPWLSGGSDALARPLTFKERVDAQAAIERVYYAHQIGATKPFEVAVPRALLEAKVRTYLRESAALEKDWKTPITTPALAREWERMERNTLLPDRLRAIEAALGNDRELILESLARPALAGRLLRNFSATDETRRDEQRLQAIATGDLPAGDRSTTSALACEPGDVWNNGSLDRLPDTRFAHTAIWTGTEMIVWGGEGGEGRGDVGIRYDPATDTWSPTSTTNAPEARYHHTAVWTGTEMIVWGGNGLISGPYLATGGRYDPASDTWASIPSGDAPSGRYGHTAVWTGTEMIVWGGYTAQTPSLLVTGGRYDPVTDRWAPTATDGAPTGRIDHSAVWTGDRMIIWGGFGGADTGGLYDPATDTWSPTSTIGAPQGRAGHTAVWTGSRLIVWGGSTTPNASSPNLDSGGLYDPATDSWAPTSLANAPAGRGWFAGVSHSAVWTGTEMIVWGGRGDGGYFDSGGRYDPAADTWTPTATANAPAAREAHSAVWTGALMIVWGGYGDESIDAGGRYDPATDTWTPTAATSTTDAPGARIFHTAIWTGTAMIVWGGFGHASLNTGGRYDPATDTWTPTSTIDAPVGRYSHTAVWTGTEMIVWGGNGFTGGDQNAGGRYDPNLDVWLPTSTVSAPERRDGHSAVWTGTRMIIWGGLNGSVLVNTGSLYNPDDDTWSPMSTTNAPTGRSSHAVVWTGTEMIVWGGFDGVVQVNNGGRYNPETDAWQSISHVRAPRPQSSVTAVWTGSRMIAGNGAGGDALISGGAQFDPTTNSWTAISSVNAPAVAYHSAVWTGTAMILWGGFGLSTFTNTGGVYDPVADSWTPTATTGAPSGRFGHTAVWTGTEMIVWGGRRSGSDEYLSSGGRYTPPTDPPGATAGADRTIECASANGTQVQLQGAGAGCGALTYTWTGPFAEGGGSVQGSDVSVTLPLGQRSITLKVDDELGRSATDTVVVTVADRTIPALVCPADSIRECPAKPSLGGAVVTDLCDPSPTVTNNAPAVFPAGETAVTYTAHDASGNTALCTAHAALQDTLPPVLAIPAGITQNAVRPTGAFVNYSATAADSCVGKVTATCAPASRSLFPINPPGESTTVVCQATDKKGNKATGSIAVHIKGAGEQMEDLRDLIVGAGLDADRAQVLLDKLAEAQAALEAGTAVDACRPIAGLGRLAVRVTIKRRPRVPLEQIASLVDATRRIRTVLACDP